MADYGPEEARWVRSAPRQILSPALLERMIQRAFPGRRIVDAAPLSGGVRNSNFKVYLDSGPDPLVLRIYEHEPALCQKELDLYRRAASSVPVPRILHAEPAGIDDLPPFTVACYIDGISFLELTRSGDREAIAQAASSAGEVLAAIGSVRFDSPGWLSAGPSVSAPLLEGADPTPRFVDACLSSPDLRRRMPKDLRRRTSGVVWSYVRQLAAQDPESRLVHGDYGFRNLLVRSAAGVWRVVGVLDWEFAVSGSSLIDVGHFLRYERSSCPLVEPHFSAGYSKAGGELCGDWRRLARIVDLAALCESLTREHMIETAKQKVIELVRATVEDRDPRL